ncbi:MAG: ABC transporter ATP-binding protein [Proteobacteria bacterium]|nr:ABC transporter ATP-binding protein [Pseudomonadota bacterium]
MIEFQNVSKYFPVEKNKNVSDGYYVLFENLNVHFKSGEKYAIMGRNGAGKSSLINMIAGTLSPTKGMVVSNVRVSWPVGYTGSFHGSLTAAQNINFITRIYGMNRQQRHDALEFCKEFADIGKHFYMPIKTYSSGMKARVSFAASMACDFDCYLLDEVTATGDIFFVKKAKAFLRKKLEKKDFIFVSHNINDIKDICTSFGVIHNKQITFFNNFQEANAFYKQSNS